MTLEITLDRATFLDPNATTLDVIYALSSGDDITARHDFRNSTTLTVR